MPLELTPSAREQLIRVRADRRIDERAAPRFSKQNGGIGLSHAISPTGTDTVVRAEGIEVGRR